MTEEGPEWLLVEGAGDALHWLRVVPAHIGMVNPFFSVTPNKVRNNLASCRVLMLTYEQLVVTL